MKRDYFSASFFRKNRSKLRKLLAADYPIILAGHTQMQRSADGAFPFRQDSNFWYLTGVDEPDIIFVQTTKASYLLLPKTNRMRDVFDGALDTAQLRKVSGVDEVLDYHSGQQLLKSVLSTHKTVATLLPITALATHFGIEPNPMRRKLLRRLKRIRPDLVTESVGETLAKLRMTKTSEELRVIEAAVKLTSEAFAEVAPLIRLGAYEYELEAAMTAVFRKNNAYHAYSPIVATGKNATILHYNSNTSRLEDGSQVLFDVGAQVAGYSADVSRTYSVGKPTDRLQAVHKAVLDVQQFGLQQLVPGITLAEFERMIETKMGEELIKLKLISNINRREIRKYYPHAISHHLGRDTHDSALYDAKLAENMVVTVEPGIYIPEEGIGVRIEDDVVITKTGNRNLCADLSRDLC